MEKFIPFDFQFGFPILEFEFPLFLGRPNSDRLQSKIEVCFRDFHFFNEERKHIIKMGSDVKGGG